MPLNELETHPYLTYLGDEPDYSSYQSMIIGSYPIYAISSSIPVEPEGVRKRANWHREAFAQFFYGSRENDFWQRFSQSVGDALPLHPTKQDLITLLQHHNFLITDAICSLYREKYSASDPDLHAVSYNAAIVDQLMQMGGNDLFFTATHSVLPFKAFKKMLRIKGVKVYKLFSTVGNSRNLRFVLNGKTFNIGFLFSPSPQGAINQNRIAEYQNYLQLFPGTLYADFVRVQWKQLLFHKNMAFDGSNPVV